MERKIAENVPVENRDVAPPPKKGWQVDKSVRGAPNVEKGAEVSRTMDKPSDTGLRGIEHAKTDQLRRESGDPNIEAKSGGISRMHVEPTAGEYEQYAREKKAEHANRKDVVESLDAKYAYETQIKAMDKHRVFHPEEKGTGIGPFETGESVLRNLEAEKVKPRPAHVGDSVESTADLVHKPRGEVFANKKGVIVDEKGQPLEQDLTKFQDRPTPVPEGKAQHLSYAQVTAIERNPDIAWNEDPEEAQRRRIQQENPPIGTAHGPEGGRMTRTGNVPKPTGGPGSIADVVGLPSTREMREMQGQGNVFTARDPSEVAKKDNEIDANVTGKLHMHQRAV